MGLPQDTLSTFARPAELRPPRNVRKARLVDYELGGVALNDASEGLEVREWRVRVIDDDIVLDAPGVDPETLFSMAEVYEVSLAFDQNMSPYVAYRLFDGSCHFRWFDSLLPGFVTLDLDEGARSPRCTLDDHRAGPGTISGLSDVILVYIRADNVLCYRKQRDRFEDEYELTPPVGTADLVDYELEQIGLGVGPLPRVQFFLVAEQPLPPPPPALVPVLTDLDPEFVLRGAVVAMLALTGSNFRSTSVVRVDGMDIETAFVDPTELEAAIPAEMLEDAGTLSITVFTPAPGGGLSDALPFEVRNPVPVIVSIDPDEGDEGDPDTFINVIGTGFLPESVVRADGMPLLTFYSSSTGLGAMIPESMLAVGQLLTITVTNPTPGGGTSNGVDFEVESLIPNPVPVLDSIDPEEIVEEFGDFLLTCTGSNFIPASVIRIDGVDLATTYNSATELEATVPGSAILDPTTIDVTVFNPEPVGGESDPQVLTVTEAPMTLQFTDGYTPPDGDDVELQFEEPPP
jgi:hypothetical protein